MSHLGLWHADRLADVMLDQIERVTGHRPPTCPWRSFSDPLVGEVLSLYRAVGGATENGAVPALALPHDPPHRVWQGLNAYASAVSLIRAEDARLAREQRSAGVPPAKPGTKRTIARG